MPTAAILGSRPDPPIKAHPKPLARIETMATDAGDTPTLVMWECVPGEECKISRQLIWENAKWYVTTTFYYFALSHTVATITNASYTTIAPTLPLEIDRHSISDCTTHCN